MQKSLIALAAIVLVGGGLYLGLHNRNAANPPASTNANAHAQGKVFFGITDAATTLQGVQQVNVTIDKVEVHSATQGWITVSTAPQTFDLMTLKNSSVTALLAQANLDAGQYDQIRVHVSNVSIQQNGNTDANVKIPSNTITLPTKLVVNADQTSTIISDFDLEKSIHVTGNGKIILIPVIKLDTQSNTDADVDGDNHLNVSAGTKDDSRTEGMDVDGSVKANFELDHNAKIDLLNNVIHLTGDNENSLKFSAKQALSQVLDNKDLDENSSIQLEDHNGTKVWDIGGTSGGMDQHVWLDANTGTKLDAGDLLNR